MDIFRKVNMFFKSFVLLLKAALKIENRRDRFTRYAIHNKWGDEETISGEGSTLKFTENLRKELPELLNKFRVKRFLDAPCGDFNWMRSVDLSNIDYIGGDIVTDIIARNKSLYEKENIRFTEIDIVKDNLPAADIWLCRDCLFHFSEAEIFQTLRNFIRSDIKYLLTTCSPECRENHDIRTGSYRELNLLIEPYSFPEPILWINDWVPPHPIQKLGLWSRDSIRSLFDDENYYGNRTYRHNEE